MISPRLVVTLAAVAVLFAALTPCDAARLEVVQIAGVTLRGNPLGDRTERQVAVFIPDGADDQTQMPLIIYLPGWGGSSQDAIANGNRGWLGRVIDQLATEKFPVRLAVVDGRSRYGGSQFLNSSATGNYADYVSDEIVAAVKTRYRTATTGPATLVAGHSSGGYGALMLGISRHATFDGVIALSPDSDFNVSHKPMVEVPAVRQVTATDIEKATGPIGKFQLPSGNSDCLYIMGLCANYSPTAGRPGKFDWIYDEQGRFREETWRRWLEADPLQVIRERKDAFAANQRVYLDGAEHDEFSANVGARKMYEALSTRPGPVTFYEPPCHHSEQLQDRLVRGIHWVLARPKHP